MKYDYGNKRLSRDGHPERSRRQITGQPCNKAEGSHRQIRLVSNLLSLKTLAFTSIKYFSRNMMKVVLRLL